MRKTIIEETENGYVVTHESRIPEENGAITVESNSHSIEGYDREGLEKLLIYLGEWFGEPYSKYGSENVRVSWDRPGHKVE